MKWKTKNEEIIQKRKLFGRGNDSEKEMIQKRKRFRKRKKILMIRIEENEGKIKTNK